MKNNQLFSTKVLFTKTLSEMRNLLAIASLGVCMASCQTSIEAEIVSKADSPSGAKTAAVGAWVRQLTDDFNAGSTFSNWSFAARKDYNSNYCTYSSGGSSISSRDFRSVLQIKATKTGTNAYSSSLLKSNYSFKPELNTEYRVSASIKLIAQNGSTFKSFTQTYGAWPAFWTVQETNWPKSGEIDILEAYSFNPSATKAASNLFYGTTTGQNLLGNAAERQYPTSYSVDGNSGWHTYDCFWKNQGGVVTVTTKVDNVTIATYVNSSVSKLNLNNFGPHNIILNLNVGSNDSSFIDPAKINLEGNTYMWVDYVTVDKRTL
jgi:Glycosyl hydrolases family 16